MRMLTLATLALFAAHPAVAELPDLAGREVSVATENAYPPLQFVDPKTGEAVGWEYDAMAEIAEAAELRGRHLEHELGRDDPGHLRGPGRHRHDRHHHPRRPQGEGRLLRPLHALRDAHAGARRRGPLHRRRQLRRLHRRPHRLPGRRHPLLRLRLRRPRRRRGQPAHQALRDHRRRHPGHARRRRRPGAGRQHRRRGLRQGQPGHLQDHRRPARRRGVRLHLPQGLGPRRADQRRHRRDEGRRDASTR